MDIESIRADGFVNQWTLVQLPTEYDEQGEPLPVRYQPRCIENAVPHDDPKATLADARNRAIAEGAETPEGVEKRAQELLESVQLPVPRYIQDWQFAHAVRLAMPDKMTEQEAEDWSARGILPKVMVDIVENLPEENRPLARLKLASTKQYDRNDPMVAMVSQFMKISSAQIDALWRLAAAL